MAARVTFDSSEYHAALKAHDGVHCLECGTVLPPREQRKPKPSALSVLSKCCNQDCKEAFLSRTLHNWAELRLKIVKRDHHTCQDCGYQAPMEFFWRFEDNDWKDMDKFGPMPPLTSYSEWRFICGIKAKITKHWQTDKGLEVHHIVPISEGGDEWDPENLITLCFDCHHLGRHGSKAPAPEEVAQKRGEERQKAEQERLQAIRARHTCLDSFSEVA